MQMPSITADLLAILAMVCAAFMIEVVRLRRSGQVIFNGGILLALSLAAACALPLLSRVNWPDLVEEASDQAIATIQLLYAAYIILTL